MKHTDTVQSHRITPKTQTSMEYCLNSPCCFSPFLPLITPTGILAGLSREIQVTSYHATE